MPHEVIVDWPHRYLAAEVDARPDRLCTVVCVLTHDPEVRRTGLGDCASPPQLGYVGAMGSRKTHQERLERLRESGAHRDRDRPTLQSDRT